jgi:xylulokinase
MSQSARAMLGMDLGTSSLKCVVMDATGKIRATAERPYPTQSPQPGWAEQNPVDWLDALRSAITELRLRESRVMNELAAIGLCSAAHLPVLLDKTDRVIRPAILWSDQRSSVEVAELKANHSPKLEDISLNEAGCTWTLPQLLWVWKNEPSVLDHVHRLLSSKDYLVFQLTGQACMDHGSAAATLMLDARSKKWSPELCALSRLPDVVLPDLLDPMAIAGHVSAAAARAFALPVGTPVIAGTLDSAAEMVGCGLLVPGAAGMVRVGSAGGIMAITDRAVFNKGIITYPHVIEGLFYKQAGTNSCATSMKWIRDLCVTMRPADAPVLTYDELDRLAAQANPGADGLMFHPYLQGERAPHWNPELRGSFTGIDQRHGWPQFIRAVMEGVAFSLLDGLTMFRREGLDMTSTVMSGGVARSPLWSQIITDVLGMPTRTIRQGDSALGACLLAATAAGLFTSLHEAVAACVKEERTMMPNVLTHDLYARSFARYQETGQFLDALARKYAHGRHPQGS